MNFNSAVESKNQQVFLPVLEEKKVELFIKREDLIDELDGILTVGGFYERAQGDGTQLLFI